MTKLTKENIETQILLYVDKELSAEESQDLLRYINRHPEYQSLLREYQESVLLPEPLTFSDKNQLLQASGRKIVPFRIISGIAATIALIMGLAIYFYRTDKPAVSSRDMAVHQANTTNRPAAMIAHQADNNRFEPELDKPVKHPVGSPQPVNRQTATTRPQHHVVTKIEPLPTLPMLALAAPTTAKISLRTVEPDLSPKKPTDLRESEHRSAEQLNDQMATFWDKSERLNGVHSLVAELDDRKNRAVDAWQRIRTSNIIVKIGSKEIMIN